ncbi:MAG: hypothetical protein ACLFTI_03040 [Anaerolineales bacterium]
MAHRTPRWQLDHRLLLIVGVGLWLCAACVPASPTAPTPALPTTSSEETQPVSWVNAPASLCRSATHLRLRPEIASAWPITATAAWRLTPADAATLLNEGAWQPDLPELFVDFPEGEPLAPGQYIVHLEADEEVIARHTFTVTATPPSVTDLTLALTPDGPEISRLADETRHFYARYEYEGACTGAPIWVVVRRGEATVCKRSLTLTAVAGQGAVACYREDGAPFEAGAYRAALTLMGEPSREVAFEIGPPPTPAPTYTPAPTATPAPTCGPLVISAGLTPDGDFVLVRESFEWYTQAIYAGRHCSHLSPATRWEATWYRNGEPTRVTGGTWAGASREVVWDSVTGVITAPFLLPGAYSVTLEIAGAGAQTAAFDVIPYSTPEP